MNNVIDPFKSKEEEKRFYLVAEVAAEFVAKYLYTLQQNGVPEEILVPISVNLTTAVISQLLVDPEAARIQQYQRFLQQWEPDSANLH